MINCQVLWLTCNILNDDQEAYFENLSIKNWSFDQFDFKNSKISENVNQSCSFFAQFEEMIFFFIYGE